MNYPIQFVSLGPGDPELITLKGFKQLQQADIIYCPATEGKQGLTSRASEIVKVLGIGESTIRPFLLPMSKERTEAWKAYDALYAAAREEHLQGKRIVIVAEGDAGFYSSIQYIYDKLMESRIPVNRTAGIPAFIAAGALAGLHIVKQEEQINVIPGTATKEELVNKIKAGMIIVLMKLPGCQDAIRESMGEYADQADFHYFENIGTDLEFYTSDSLLIQRRKFPYFSLMIIQPHG